MSASVLIEAVEAGGFGGGGVVMPAFEDVQVADVFDGRDDRLDPGIQLRLVLLHHGDVTHYLLPCQPVQVRPHRLQGIEGALLRRPMDGFGELPSASGAAAEFAEDAPGLKLSVDTSAPPDFHPKIDGGARTHQTRPDRPQFEW
jgi:hypothetical protein